MFLVAYTPLTIGFELFVGSWLLTTHKDIKKAWNLTFAYSLSRGSGKPFRKNKQRTPTPNMNATKQSSPLLDALRWDIHIPKGVYCHLVLGDCKIYQIS